MGKQTSALPGECINHCGNTLSFMQCESEGKQNIDGGLSIFFFKLL